MDRREFIKVSGAGIMTVFLSGCGLVGLNDSSKASAVEPAAGGGNEGGAHKMKITVVTGSPHENGTSALLADKFIEGAQQAGHDVFRFNAAFEDTHPCLGCDHCMMDGPCVHGDAIEQKLMPNLLAAELIVLVTPLYYFGMSAQLKTIVDRFYSRNGKLHGGKKTMLMATAYNNDDWTMSALVDHYDTVAKYMGWQDVGKVLAVGCGSRSLVEHSKFPDQAYQLGLRM